MIANRYIKGTFIYDLIPLIPFQFFINLENIFGKIIFLLKLFRLQKGFNILDVGRIMSKIKAKYQ